MTDSPFLTEEYYYDQGRAAAREIYPSEDFSTYERASAEYDRRRLQIHKKAFIRGYVDAVNAKKL
ncbi:MAG: hypothetical protein MUE70_05495 [Desulfobacterales bacterium]|jgi:hypothetical protein|nr:hypothetical protein [Desulfobacterales bacterium]